MGCPWVRAVEVGISPPDVHLNLNPGQLYQGEFKVFGSDRESVAVNIYPMDWTLTATGDYQFLPAGVVKRSLIPWLTLESRDFALPPGAAQRIGYTLRVPENAQGSYWGVVMCGATPPPASGKERVRIGMSGRMAFIIRVDVDSPAPSGVVERYKLGWDPVRKRLNASLRLRNNGAAFLYYRGYLELRNIQGQKVGMAPLQNGIVLPDASREVRLADGNGPPPFSAAPGTYIGLTVIDTGERSLKAVQATVEIK